MAAIGLPATMSPMLTAPLTTPPVVINCCSGDLTAGSEGRKIQSRCPWGKRGDGGLLRKGTKAAPP